jgi:hypothetical protein
MGTTAFDTKTFLNLKGGLALSVKDPVKMPVQEDQPGRNSFSPVSETEKSAFEEMMALIGLQSAMPFSRREDAPLPVAGTGRAGKKLHSLTEKKEQTEDAKTAILRPKAMMKQAVAIPGAGESVPLVDPSSTENAHRQMAPLHKSNTPLFAQAVKQEAAHPQRDTGETPEGKPTYSSLEGAERRTEPVFMKRADQTLKLKNDGMGTEGVLDAGPTGPLHRDHSKRAGESKESASVIAAPQKPISDAGRGGATIAQAAPERTTPWGSSDQTLPGRDAVTETTGPVRDHQRGRNATDNRQMRPPIPAGNGDRTIAKTVPERMTPLGSPAQILFGRDAMVETMDMAGEHRQGRNTTANHRMRTPSPAGDGDAMATKAAPERMTPWGSPDQTLLGRDAVTETMGPARDHQQSGNTTPNHQMKLPERDMFPFRMEMPNVTSQQETRPFVAVGSAGIEMQSVIDQILEARQGVGNDFGRIRILLNPPHLGSVDLDIVIHGEKVDVVMTAENATVQQALQSRAEDIRIALQRQELKIETFHVLLQDNTTNQQQANSGAAFEQHRGQWARQTDPEDSAPIQPLIRSAGESATAQGLVSIFV